MDYGRKIERGFAREGETFEKRSILSKAKEGENFNHRNT
jgi:hypothetical protein